MEMRTLGRTGLRVSVMGLGCGGHSRLGISQGKGEANAIAVVRRALDLGINCIDTAEQYGTEALVGKALNGVARESVVLSTKISPRQDGQLRTAAQVQVAVDERLRLLQTDHIDVLHLHGISAADYAFCASEMAPALEALRAAGKIRFLGITEAFAPDPRHRMLTNGALQDDFWSVIMVGFSILNQSARDRVFPTTTQRNIGVLDMFAVRRALSNPDALNTLIDGLAAEGKLDRADFPDDAPLGFVVKSGAAVSVPDAAYRFCRDEPGVQVVLSGTGSIEHLEANAESLSRPPLPPEVSARLRELFAGIDTVSGD